MVRVSNWLIVGLNVVTLAVALTAVGFSLWFHVRDGSQCQRVLKAPLMAVGVALIVVAALGLAGALTGASLLMWLYLSMLLALIVALVVFTIFTVMVTNKGLGQAISGQGVGDHRLGNYSKWLQKYVLGARNWDKIKSCMQDAQFCKFVVDLKSDDDVYKQINPIVSGCCKPPGYCGFERKNGSYWAQPKKSQGVADDPDCKTWSNEPERMCFDCNSCKRAVLENIRREWKVLALINICIVVVVVAVYSVGCCALRNNRFYQHNNSYNKPNP